MDRKRRLEGKVAIVTGAGCVGPGWGNGRAIACRFAEEGARVVAVDRDLAAMAETLDLIARCGGAAVPLQYDVTDMASVDALFHESTARIGRPDILVNNVGGPIAGGLRHLSGADWKRQIDLNLNSVFHMSKAAVAMMEDGGGNIINIASTSAIMWTGAPQIGYAAAKGAVVQFTRVAAVELAAHGIRVNAILPGQLHTPLVDAVLAGAQSGGDIELLLKRRRDRIPMPLTGDGRDTANAALFLASDEARFITGASLVVDGGMTLRCD